MLLLYDQCYLAHLHSYTYFLPQMPHLICTCSLWSDSVVLSALPFNVVFILLFFSLLMALVKHCRPASCFVFLFHRFRLKTVLMWETFADISHLSQMWTKNSNRRRINSNKFSRWGRKTMSLHVLPMSDWDFSRYISFSCWHWWFKTFPECESVWVCLCVFACLQRNLWPVLAGISFSALWPIMI